MVTTIKVMAFLWGLTCLVSCTEKPEIILNDRGEWYVTTFSNKSSDIFQADKENVIILPCELETSPFSVDFLESNGSEIGLEDIHYFSHRNDEEYNYYVFYVATLDQSKMDKVVWESDQQISKDVYSKKLWLVESLLKKDYRAILQACSTENKK